MDAFQGHSGTPLWRAEMALPPVPPAQVEPREDVLVVGSGFTGLHTALHLARIESGADPVMVFLHRPSHQIHKQPSG